MCDICIVNLIGMHFYYMHRDYVHEWEDIVIILIYYVFTIVTLSVAPYLKKLMTMTTPVPSRSSYHYT